MGMRPKQEYKLLLIYYGIRIGFYNKLVVSMNLVRLDDAETAIKFAEEVSTSGVQNVMMHAATSDEVLDVLVQGGLVPYQYHMESASFSRIVIEQAKLHSEPLYVAATL